MFPVEQADIIVKTNRVIIFSFIFHGFMKYRSSYFVELPKMQDLLFGIILAIS